MKLRPYLSTTLTYALRQKKKVIFLILLVVLETVARLAQPYLYKLVVDILTLGLVAGAFDEASSRFLIIIVGVWFLLTVASNLINAQSQYLVWHIGNRSSQWIHMEGYRKLLRMDYHKHTKKHSSRFAKIVDEADTSMWEMTNWWLNRFFPSILGFVGMLIVAFSVSWQMTILTLLVIPPGLYLIVTIIKKSEDRQHEVNKLWNRKHSHLSDQISNIITYKLNQNEKLFMKAQKGFSDRAAEAQLELNKKWRLATMLNPDVLARFLVMGVGVLLVQNGSITLGTLFMFMGLMNEILTPLHLLGDILPQYSRRARHIDRLAILMNEKESVTDPRRPVKVDFLKGKIQFEDVSFRYPGNGEKGFALKDISLTIEPGEHVAIVGHSGSGKTTFASLLARVMDPVSGRILVDGIDIRQFKQETYRSFLGTVLQEHSLYNESIAQNIAYGNFRASRAEIIAAAKKAQADEFIRRLPQKYDTIIGERGVRLSGGEKQRLAIARAILKTPRIVLLDEPTSALDSITEAKVQKGLLQLMEGRTTITIAHRLSTVRNADKILVMENGRVLAMGSHAELIRTCRDYRDMVALQTGGFLADEGDKGSEAI